MSKFLVFFAVLATVLLASLLMPVEAHVDAYSTVLAPFYDSNCTDRVPYPEVAENPNVTLTYNVSCNYWAHGK
jgi:hypothetical protein